MDCSSSAMRMVGMMQSRENSLIIGRMCVAMSKFSMDDMEKIVENAHIGKCVLYSTSHLWGIWYTPLVQVHR